MALSGMAMHHAGDSHSRCGGKFAWFSLIRKKVLTYLPDGSNIYGSRVGKFEGMGLV